MGKRYYCDYCDKTFADNPTNRRLHLSGTSHIRSKKAHYECVKSEQEILQDDLKKLPCRTFEKSGDCRFGANCQFSHLTNADRAKLTEKVRLKEEKKRELERQEKQKLSELSKALPKWLELYSEKTRIKQAKIAAAKTFKTSDNTGMKQEVSGSKNSEASSDESGIKQETVAAVEISETSNDNDNGDDDETSIKSIENKGDEKKEKEREEEEDGCCSSEVNNLDFPKYEIGQCFHGVVNDDQLPPSLLPPTRENIINGHYPEWG